MWVDTISGGFSSQINQTEHNDLRGGGWTRCIELKLNPSKRKEEKKEEDEKISGKRWKLVKMERS